MLKLILVGSAIAALGLVAILAQGNSTFADLESRKAFRTFTQEEAKRYSSLEETEYRFSVFRSNLKMIEEHNAKSESTYTLGINRFADMTFKELSEKYLTKFPEENYSVCEGEENGSLKFDPDLRKIDWVDKGMVTPVKNQGTCGSCYSFGAIGGIESALAISGKPLRRFSEQQIVDCSADYHNHGCGGGLISNSYHFLMDHGLVADEDYPYKGKRNECASEGKKEVIRLKGCRQVGKSVDELIKTVQTMPVPVAFVANPDLFFYKFGVYNPSNCGSSVNHAVLLVGYDKDYKTPFFRIKNSWGTWWGKSGYLYIAIGSTPDGVCNVAGSGHNFIPILP